VYKGKINKETLKKDGFGMQVFPDGTIFEGFFKNGRKNGKGRLLTHKGEVILGDWMGGKIKDQPAYTL